MGISVLETRSSIVKEFKKIEKPTFLHDCKAEPLLYLRSCRHEVTALSPPGTWGAEPTSLCDFKEAQRWVHGLASNLSSGLWPNPSAFDTNQLWILKSVPGDFTWTTSICVSKDDEDEASHQLFRQVCPRKPKLMLHWFYKYVVPSFTQQATDATSGW